MTTDLDLQKTHRPEAKEFAAFAEFRSAFQGFRLPRIKPLREIPA